MSEVKKNLLIVWRKPYGSVDLVLIKNLYIDELNDFLLLNDFYIAPDCGASNLMLKLQLFIEYDEDIDYNATKIDSNTIYQDSLVIDAIIRTGRVDYENNND